MTPTTQLEPLFQSVLSELELHQPSSIDFEVPNNLQFGDYSTNLALILFSKAESDSKIKSLYSNPRQLAEAVVAGIKEKLTQDQNSPIEDISIAGPGFINLKLSTQFLLSKLRQMVDQPDQIITQTGKDRTAIVEYSSPNIAKPFTIGHLRSTIIGQAVANILEAKGWNVKRDNHLGDWGTQFGKQIYAIKTWGNEAEIAASDQPVKKLVELYVKFHEEAEKNPALDDEGRAWFKKLEDGDPEARRLWQQCIEWSWKEFESIYQRLKVTFTENNGRGFGESYFEDKMQPVLVELEKNSALEYRDGEDGAKLIFFPNDELPPLMILKKDGTTLYATRDLATDVFRLQTYGSDITIINEVGAEQALYFKQIFKTEELLGWFKPTQRVHVKHGLYRFKDTKMSTRKGNVIWLADVLNEAEQRAKQLAERPKNGPSETAEAHTSSLSEDQLLANARAISVGALKWNDLKRSSHLDVVFDWDEILNMQGNSGPYLQYSYVRASSILAKAATTFSAEQTQEIGSIAKRFDTLLYILMPSEKSIITHLLRFDETIELAANEYSPHHIATYLYELAQKFNTFYNSEPILSEEVANETKAVRLALTTAVQNTLKTGLALLGIETVEKM